MICDIICVEICFSEVEVAIYNLYENALIELARYRQTKGRAALYEYMMR